MTDNLAVLVFLQLRTKQHDFHCTSRSISIQSTWFCTRRFCRDRKTWSHSICPLVQLPGQRRYHWPAQCHVDLLRVSPTGGYNYILHDTRNEVERCRCNRLRGVVSGQYHSGMEVTKKAPTIFKNSKNRKTNQNERIRLTCMHPVCFVS